MPAVIVDAASQLISLKQASKEGFGAYSTLRARVKSGELPAVRIGRLIKVRRSDLRLLLKPVSTSEPELAPASVSDVEPDESVTDAAVAAIVAAAPTLSDAQISRLRAVLGGDL